MADEFVLVTPVVNISYKRGDSRAIVFLLKNVDTGLPQDLTDWTSPLLSVNTEAKPTDKTNELFQIIGVIDTDPLTGRIAFSPTTIQSDQTPATFYYDAQVLDSSSGLLTFVEGKFKIVQDIVKD